MPTDDSNKYDSFKRKCVFVASNPFFILGLLLLLLVEVRLIYKLWIRPKYPVDLSSSLVLQIAFLLPFLVISVLLYRIDTHLHKEEISPSFAEALNVWLLSLLMVVYLAFSLFLSFATR